MESNLQLNNIHSYLKQPEIVTQTALQISKDFAMCGEIIEFKDSTSCTYNELYKTLNAAVKQLCETNIEKFSAILYRVDIPQKQVNELLSHTFKRVPYEELAQLIIVREAKKVIIRNYFSQKS